MIHWWIVWRKHWRLICVIWIVRRSLVGWAPMHRAFIDSAHSRRNVGAIGIMICPLNRWTLPLIKLISSSRLFLFINLFILFPFLFFIPRLESFFNILTFSTFRVTFLKLNKKFECFLHFLHIRNNFRLNLLGLLKHFLNFEFKILYFPTNFLNIFNDELIVCYFLHLTYLCDIKKL